MRRVLSVLVTFLLAPRLEAQRQVEVSPDQVRQIGTLAEAWHDAGLLDGAVMVAQDGQVLFERAYGPASVQWDITNTPETLFPLESLSKQFTAMAVLQLVRDGMVALDSPVGAYLPRLRPDVGRRVTIQDLLRHTSGLAEETPFRIERHTDRAIAPDELFRLINAQAPVLAPGTVFSYNNVNYILLSWVVEAARGRAFADVLRDSIFEPLGMRHTGFPPPRGFLPGAAESYARIRGRIERPEAGDDSWYRGAGGLYSTVGDLLIWDRALAGTRLLPDSLLERMFTAGPLGPYGFGWSIARYSVAGRQGKLVYHSGGGPTGSAMIRRYLDDGLLVVVLSNTGSTQAGAVAQQIGTVLLGGTGRPPGRPIDDAIEDALMGHGLDSALSLFRAARADSALRVPGGPTLERMAYEFLRTGRTAEALQLFHLVTAIYPAASNPWDSYGEAWLVAGRRDSAIRDYGRAVELDLNKINARFMLAELGVRDPTRITSPLLRAILERGTAAALAARRRFVGTADTLGEDYVNAAGYTLLRHGRAREALRLFEYNAAAYPDSWNVWDSLGEAQLLLGRRDDAIRSYRRSLELNPRSPTGLEALRRLGVPAP